MFAKRLLHQIMSEEANFLNLYGTATAAVKAFERRMYAHWPGSFRCFLEHLVAFGVDNSDPSIIKYAFDKFDEVKKEPIAPNAPRILSKS